MDIETLKAVLARIVLTIQYIMVRNQYVVAIKTGVHRLGDGEDRVVATIPRSDLHDLRLFMNGVLPVRDRSGRPLAAAHASPLGVVELVRNLGELGGSIDYEVAEAAIAVSVREATIPRDEQGDIAAFIEGRIPVRKG